MASSESQGVMISLIIFIMLTIVLSVTTFMFFQNAETATAEAEQANQARNEANTAAGSAQAELNDIKRWLGADPAANREEVQKLFTEDMAGLADTLPPDQQTYHAALTYLADINRTQSNDLVEEKARVLTLENRVAQVESDKQAAVAVAEAARQKAEEDLKARTDELLAINSATSQSSEELAEQNRKLQEEKDAQAAQSLADRNVLEQQVAVLERDNENKNDKLEELTKTTFEVADGKIIWIDPGAHTVWINLGHGDGLRRQVSFSVFGRDAVTGGDDVLKGKIEVTQVIGSHFAEARILDDDISDPLLPGDNIYTPLWHPGRSEHFALVGSFDLDGDAFDDREMIRDLITMAGGVVDAEVDLEGNLSGQLDINTRYVVAGDPPEDESVSGAYSDMLREAEVKGVERINISKFLDHIGWKDPKRVIRFGRRGNANDVPPALPDGGRRSSSGTVSDLFRKRLPPGYKAPEDPTTPSRSSAY